MKRVALVGCGNLGSMIARGIGERLSGSYQLVAVTDSRMAAAQTVAEHCGCRACPDLGDLLGQKPDYVVEAAAPPVLKAIAEEILRSGADLLPLSVGAFADEEFYRRVWEVAQAVGQRIFIVSGAIGGFDIMQAAMLAGPLSAEIVSMKDPRALAGAPGLAGRIPPRDREETVFSGTAREAIEAFPQNVTVAVALATATVGADQTRVQVKSVPGMARNTHRISLGGAFGEAVIEICSRPSPDNPKSSGTAALSVLAKLKNLAQPVSFC